MRTSVSRKENVIRNGKYGVIKFLVQILLQFFVKTIFIRVLGEEYLGINSVFTSILGVLNVVELGMGSAIVFSMYKPVAENDVETVKSLVALYKKIYTIIAIIVTILGVGLIPFLKYFITGETQNLEINFIAVYLVYLGNAIINYLSAHRRSLIFAYQRNDIESKIKTISLSVLYLAQIVALLVFKSFYLYVILMPVTTLFDVLMIYFESKKLWPEISGKTNRLDKKVESEIKKNVFAMSMHQVGATVVCSTDSLLISVLISTAIAGIYSNYYTIIYTVTSMFAVFTTVFRSSVGNLIATSNKDYTLEIFYNLNSIVGIMAGFCSIALLCLFQPFIPIWTGSTSYLLDFNIVLVLCIQFYLSIMRSVPAMFKDCAGLMWQDRWKPICEAIVNLVASILLAKWLGLIGIFLGTIISTLVAPFWVEPHVLFKYYFKKNTWKYWLQYLMNTLATVVIGAVTFFLCSLLPTTGIFIFIAKVGICTVVPLGLYLLFYCRTSEFKFFKNFVSSFINKKKIKL